MPASSNSSWSAGANSKRPRGCATKSSPDWTNACGLPSKHWPRTTVPASCKKRSTRRRLPRSWPGGPGFRSRACWRRRVSACCTWSRSFVRRVVGQDEALCVVADAIRRSRAGLNEGDPPAGLVPVRGSHRRRQDGAGARAGGVPVRRREGPGTDRHVGVRRTAQCVAADRRPTRIRGLRRGRPVDGGRAPAALLGRAAGRSGEGAPRGVQHPVAASGTTAD